MAVTYSTAVKTARMQAVIDNIDAGASPGTIEIGTGSMASVLCVITLADPSGTAASGVLTFDFSPAVTGTATAGGTAAEARFKDSSGTVVISGLTVGTSGANINLDSVTISSGQTVTLTSGTISHA